MDEIELRAQLEKHHSVCYGWALNCCSHDRTEAKDVLQMAYMKVLEGKASYKGQSSFKTWFFSVIRNTAAEEWRRHWFRRLGLAKFAQEQVTASDDGEPRDMSEVSKAFRSIFAKLPGRQQEVLHLVFYQDMSVQEASVVMGVSIGSARTHYERGKENMRKFLRHTGTEALSSEVRECGSAEVRKF
ncbi:MAG TPA: RNA polymerase [Lentisphaeria bacterium]|nr:MAG: hypothetical protein A2X48_19080 [Lentisphaerae bacterium GWF2_49_21]HBC87244.1 RNA polymerase [Lentisphaeria bacterium]